MFSLKLKRWILTACLAGSMGVSLGANVLNISAATTDPLGTMSGISGVTFATQNGDASGGGERDPGKMFTTNKDSNPLGCDLKSGYTIQTKYYGTTLTKDRLQVGQHLYDSETAKLVKVSKWVLSHPGAQCIHGPYDMPELNHGTQKCDAYYNETNPGWLGYCADCGELIQNLYYYMDTKTATALDHIQMDYLYYYKCPYCTNLEQAVWTNHKCKEISWNKYKIEYKGNGSKVIGSMGNSTHMYNNATEYKGNTLEKVQTSLSKNKYQRPGYSFVGWNTKKDGTGTSYTDEQEILNLTTENEGKITLYAQWEKCDTTLLIKAEDGTNATSGATYNGKAQYSTKVDYLGTERVQKSLTIPGKGYKINFDTNGGTITGMGQTGLKNVNGTSGYTTVSVRDAKDWIQTFPNEFNSSYEADGSDAIFTNKATENGYTYILQVTYNYGSFTLPGVNKEGQSFVGWELITGVGNKQFATGEGVTPTENISTNGEITFKAKYAELSMQATPDYETNNMKGAADLVWEWTQNVTNISSYKIYRDGNLININASGDEGEMPNLGTVIDSYASGTFTVEYSGVYEFTLKGNKGTDYNGHTGGSGGYITGQVFLNKGDILQYTSSDSDYAGGKGEKSSGGNAATIKIKRAGTNNFVPLIVAGGGSGASDTTNGTSVAVSAETGAANNSHIGSAGMYAGGGGWTGGAAGELIYHDHAKSYCVYHKHDDGCYYSHKHGDSCYGDWKTDHWCSVCGESWNIVGDNMCGNPKCEGNPEAVLQWGEPYWDADELICTKDTGIDYSNRICGKTETWYTKEGEKCTLDGAVESAKSASAGTNYINAEEVFNYSFSTNAGKGSVFVKSVKLGFETDTYLNDAKAEDKAAPDRPVLTLTSTDYAKKQAVFSIKKPNDNGTAYTFSVEAYANGNKQASATAVPNPVVLTTNVKGYKIKFYNKNTNALLNTVTTNLKVLQKARDGLATVTDSADVKYTRALQTYPQQVRVYAIDFAGNTSAVATLDLPGISETQKPSDPVTPDTTYPVETEYVKAVENANTYRKGNKTVSGTSYPLYYVKADGQTPFTLLGRGYTSGAADLNLFRVHEFDYKILDIAKNTNVKDPNTTYAVNTEELDTAFTQTGYGVPTNKTQLLDAYTSPEYKRDTENGQKGVQTKMLFTASSAENGKQMLVIPGAAGKNLNTDKEVTSDAAKDKKSGVVLIPDAEAPYVNGGNIDELKKIEEGTFKFPTTITIPIKDDLSGVSNAFAEVSSTQSGSYKKYPMDENGNIVIKVTEDDVLFVADITISITTIDNVGNEGHFEYYYSAAMKLDIDIVNKDALVNGKEKHNYFLYDDTGILYIHTEGYVDRIEISQGTNPKALFTDNNKTTYTISFDGSKADLMLGWAELEYDKELEFKVTEYMESEVYFEVTCKKTGSGNVTVNHYKQNVDGKGYTLEAITSVPGRVGASYTATPYKFTGFTSPASQTVTVSDDTVIDLYYERNKYTVTLETEEGVKSVSGAGTYYYGQPVTVSMTEKKGYTFSKWVGNIESSTSKDYTFKMPAYDVTLRANMTGNNYIINFDGNGATGGKTEDISLAYGESVKLPTNGYTKEGYEFVGWNTKPDGTGTSYKAGQTIKDLGETNEIVTLYAQWKIASYTIIYDGNGHTSGNMANTTLEYGETGTLRANTFTKTGYVFTGWNTKADGTGISYGDKASVRNLVSDGTSITLYAQWGAKGYSVVFDGNGATAGRMPTITIAFDQTENIPKNEYTRKGYEFTGWNTKADGTGTKFTDEDRIRNLTTGDSITLYAQWKATAYTIIYDANGGSGNMNKTNVTYGTNVSIKENGFTAPNGITFAGWTTKSNGTDDGYNWTGWTGTWEFVNGERGVKDNTLTLYARWTSLQYTYNIRYESVSGLLLGTDTATNSFGNTKLIAAKDFVGYTTPASQYVTWDSVTPKTIVFTYPLVDYRAILDLDGGTGASSFMFTIESEDKKLGTPTKEGYTFLGWTGSNGTTPQKDVTIEKGSYGDKHYTANWKANDIVYNIEYVTESKITLGTDTITGSFGDLKTVTPIDFTGYTTPSSQNVTWDSVTPKTITFIYKPISYYVSIDNNGGTGVKDTLYTIESESFTLEQPTKEGYTFLGWTGSNGETPQTDVTIEKGSYGDKNYVANWKANDVTYTIKYVTESGSTLGTDTITKEYGSTQTVSAKDFDGYTTPDDQTIEWDNVTGGTITFTYKPIIYNIIIDLNGGMKPEDAPAKTYTYKMEDMQMAKFLCEYSDNQVGTYQQVNLKKPRIVSMIKDIKNKQMREYLLKRT